MVERPCLSAPSSQSTLSSRSSATPNRRLQSIPTMHTATPVLSLCLLAPCFAAPAADMGEAGTLVSAPPPLAATPSFEVITVTSGEPVTVTADSSPTAAPTPAEPPADPANEIWAQHNTAPPPPPPSPSAPAPPAPAPTTPSKSQSGLPTETVQYTRPTVTLLPDGREWHAEERYNYCHAHVHPASITYRISGQLWGGKNVSALAFWASVASCAQVHARHWRDPDGMFLISFVLVASSSRWVVAHDDWRKLWVWVLRSCAVC